jgi:hypothetical protein
MKSVKS